MNKKLYGVGTGPGASKLLTLDAVDKLKNADIIFAPNNKGKTMSLDTVRDFIDESKVYFLHFPMKSVTDEIYDNAAQQIFKLIPEGGNGVFITIGDPNIYSTFTFIMERLKDKLDIEIVSGIPSFVAAAAASKISLCKKGESVLLIDELSSIDKIEHNTIALLKTHLDVGNTIDLFTNKGYSYKYIKRASLEDELVLEDKDEILLNHNYISLILAKKGE